MNKERLAKEQEAMRMRLSRRWRGRYYSHGREVGLVKKQKYRPLLVCDLPMACELASRALSDNKFMSRALKEASIRLENLQEDKTVIERNWCTPSA